MRMCFVENCERKHKARNLCSIHYDQEKRANGFLNKTECNLPIMERISLNSIKNNHNDCIEWTGHKHSWGYGLISYKNKPTRVHRIVFEHAHGPIDEGMFICHSCDNPGCINIDHLFVGTPAENAFDMRSKKRHVIPIGEHNGKAKLTVDQVVEIKKLFLSGFGNRRLSRMFNISRDAIMDIKSGKTWNHVQLEELKG